MPTMTEEDSVACVNKPSPPTPRRPPRPPVIPTIIVADEDESLDSQLEATIITEVIGSEEGDGGTVILRHQRLSYR